MSAAEIPPLSRHYSPPLCRALKMRLKREREREREREGGGNFISLLTFEGEEKKGKKGGRGRKNEPVKRSLPASFVAAFFFPHPLPSPSTDFSISEFSCSDVPCP